MKALLILLLSLGTMQQALAQQKAKPHKHAAYKTTTQRKVVKKQVHAVYYPDFYTFYDSSRNGFVYWDNNSWRLSADRPSFMKDADVGKMRIELLHDESMTGFPESNYEQYLQLYPPQPVSPTVPVPIITIRKKKN